MNKPVAWIWSEDGYDIGVCLEQDKQMGKEFEQYTIPLYTNPVKPAICVGHWDNKTGAFHKHLTESQQKRVDEGFLQPVYTAGMLSIRELTDEEILEELLIPKSEWDSYKAHHCLKQIRAILRKAQET